MNLDVCLSLKLIDNYDLNNTSVVLIDVVRASTTISAAIDCGIEHIVALSDIEQTRAMKSKGYITAGERNGKMIEGFDYGNSPLIFAGQDGFVNGKLAITTTNGTRTLSLLEAAAGSFIGCDIVIGAFVNHDAVRDYLLQKSKHVLMVCSGWKSNVSIEDTLFAGKLAESLLATGDYNVISDGAAHAIRLYNIAKDNLYDFVLSNSARFKGKPGSLHKDIKYCMRNNIIDSVSALKNGLIVKV